MKNKNKNLIESFLSSSKMKGIPNYFFYFKCPEISFFKTILLTHWCLNKNLYKCNVITKKDNFNDLKVNILLNYERIF